MVYRQLRSPPVTVWRRVELEALIGGRLDWRRVIRHLLRLLRRGALRVRVGRHGGGLFGRVRVVVVASRGGASGGAVLVVAELSWGGVAGGGAAAAAPEEEGEEGAGDDGEGDADTDAGGCARGETG